MQLTGWQMIALVVTMAATTVGLAAIGQTSMALVSLGSCSALVPAFVSAFNKGGNGNGKDKH